MTIDYEQNEIHTLNLDFETNSYILISIDANGGEEVETPECVIVDKIFSEGLKKYGYVCHYIYHHYMNYIIASADEKMRHNVLETLTNTLVAVGKNHNISFSAGVGGVYKTRQGISRSCRESRRALEFCLAKKNVKIIEHAKVSGGATYNYFYSRTTEEHLMAAVKTNNKEKLRQELDMIFSGSVIDGEQNLSIVRLISRNLLDTLCTIFSAAGYNVIKVFPDEYKFIKGVHQKNDIDEIIRTIRSMYERCYEELYAEQTERSVFIDGVIKFNNENYLNADFNIRAIADEFGLSRGYIARVFKNETGTSINDYIMIERINKAKELLENSDELIEKIAMEAGFSNYRTFARNFMEMVGVLPKKYRKHKKKEIPEWLTANG
jgi:two-component system response regulator YesN